MPFTYDPKTFRAVSEDGTTYVQLLGSSREKAYRFCLHWKGTKSVFKCRLEQRGWPPGRVQYDWTIEALPVPDLNISSHDFTSDEEYQEAVGLARAAMQVMLVPGAPFPGEVSSVSARLSPELHDRIKKAN